MDVARAIEILELPSDASFDQVRHSYKELVFIWHPDRHSGNPQAQARASRKMTEINEAYETLCSYFATIHSETGRDRQADDAFGFITCPVCGLKNRVPESRVQVRVRCRSCKSELSQDGKKESTDRVVCGDAACTGIIRANGRCIVCGRTVKEGEQAYRDREQGMRQRHSSPPTGQGETKSHSGVMNILTAITAEVFAAKPVKWAFWCFLVAGLAYLVAVNNLPNTFSTGNTHEQPRYVRPTVAPNGVAWPSISSYVPGYPRRATSGLSRVTVDNSKNDSDVFVKLFALNGRTSAAVRAFFIKAGEKFTVRSILAGTYDVRYKNLDNGCLGKSESFDLTEKQEEAGIRASTIELTLYKVSHGNMKVYQISEENF